MQQQREPLEALRLVKALASAIFWCTRWRRSRMRAFLRTVDQAISGRWHAYTRAFLAAQ